jgi:hypothetical protein
VNEADKTLTYHIESAFNPGNEGIDTKSTVSLSGDDLKLVSAGGSTSIWKRTTNPQANVVPNGVFKLNVAKSKYSSGPAPRGTIIYVAGEKITLSGTNAAGEPVVATFPNIEDGKPHQVTGVAAYDETAITRVDAHTVNINRTKAGKVVQTAVGVMSQDGKTLTITATGTNEKDQQINNTTVWEKL